MITDVAKDGMLAEPNLTLLRDVCAPADRPVIASGGVSDLADLQALMTLVPLGLEAAVIGCGLHTGRITVVDALHIT